MNIEEINEAPMTVEAVIVNANAMMLDAQLNPEYPFKNFARAAGLFAQSFVRTNTFPGAGQLSAEDAA